MGGGAGRAQVRTKLHPHDGAGDRPVWVTEPVDGLLQQGGDAVSYSWKTTMRPWRFPATRRRQDHRPGTGLGGNVRGLVAGLARPGPCTTHRHRHRPRPAQDAAYRIGAYALTSRWSSSDTAAATATAARCFSGSSPARARPEPARPVADLVAAELDRVHARIAGRFARSEPRARVRGGTYLGWWRAWSRKNGWTLAERAGEGSPDGMQRLLRCGRPRGR
jgi:hypothetical protein